MNRKKLVAEIKKKESFLCIGLDTDINKIPKFLLSYEDPIFEFNKRIIDATHEFAVAYKPNCAFYEARGWRGWQSLEKTQQYISSKGCFAIADAKRGDIGNTSGLYARAFFNKEESGLDFDAITVAPYMGEDSVTPFIVDGKWVILLALTSNKGADDFQYFGSGDPLYEEVLKVSQQWGSIENVMYVVGATKAESLANIRTIVPDHFLLVPGVGAQGGSLADVAKYGMSPECCLLVNNSRAIIYASDSDDFAQAAAVIAKRMQSEMAELLKEHGVI